LNAAEAAEKGISDDPPPDSDPNADADDSGIDYVDDDMDADPLDDVAGSDAAAAGIPSPLCAWFAGDESPHCAYASWTPDDPTIQPSWNNSCILSYVPHSPHSSIHPSIHPSIYMFTDPPTHHRPSCIEPTAQNFVDPQCTCLCFFEDTPLVDPRCKGWFGDLLQAVATPAASGDPGTVTASSVAAVPPPPAAPSGSGVPGS
jgi:hypothetical protein